VGSFCVMITTALCAIPLGIAAGVYLEEYAPKNLFTQAIIFFSACFRSYINTSAL